MSVPLVPKQANAPGAAAKPKREISRKELLGIGAAIVASMVLFQVFRWVSGGTDSAPTGLPEISPRELQQALAKWRESGPKDYDLEMVVNSDANETQMLLEVRDGEGRRLVRDGIESTRPEELAQWTIDGQLAQIAAYIERDTSPAAHNAGRNMINVGRLHPDLGYPIEYSRQGTGDQTKFHVSVTFKQVDP